MARRIRRRPGVVWLPLTTENRLVTVPNGDSPAFGSYAVIIPPASVIGQQITGVFPVVADQPQLPTSLTSSLADVEGSAYRLRRIVGKIWVELDQNTVGGATDANDIIVTAGFIILEVETSLAFLPKSATQDDYNVANFDGNRSPWIWRRSWRLGASGTAGAGEANFFGGVGVQAGAGGGPSFSPLPANNIMTAAGGVMDGPHIDAKTARVVKDNERLSLVVTATQISPGPSVSSAVIVATTDLRVLASLRRQSGNRHNASR